MLLCARAASPQTATGAGTALQDLIHGAQVDPSTQPLFAPAVARLIATEIGTFPIASSSSGFTYTFDPQLGIPVLGSRSFGSMFIERPETAGRGKWTVGFNVQHTNWASIDGLSLQNGDFAGFFVDEQGNQTTAQSFINLSTTTAVFVVTAGVTDRIDVTVGIPFVSQSVSGHIVAPVALGGNRSVSGLSSGVGDISLHAKVKIVEARELGLGGSVEVKLPTGDETQLLGVGKAQYRVQLIASAGSGIVASHLNFGYTIAGSGFPPNTGPAGEFAASSTDIQPSNELNYSGGFDMAPLSRLTLSADVVGRSLRNNAQVTGFPALAPRARLPLLIGVVGVKINVAAQWLVLASVLFPLSNNGLKPGLTPIVGLERAF